MHDFRTVLLSLPLFLSSVVQAQVEVRPNRGSIGVLTVRGEDGREQPCELRSLVVRVELDGHFARTEVEQIFHNPLPMQTEGTFDFRLPPDAAINRLAMEIDGRLMEGEIVEREKARAVYDQIKRQMRDPALLEWQGGERFKTHVFPIPPGGDKRVVLSYLTRLDAVSGGMEYRYLLPVAAEGSEPIGNFRMQLMLSGADQPTVNPYDARIQKVGALTEIVFEQGGFRPRGDFTVRISKPQSNLEIFSAQRGGQKMFLLEAAPDWTGLAKSEPRDLVLLVDSSASMRESGWGQMLTALPSLIAALKPQDRLMLITGDADLRPAKNGFVSQGQASTALSALKAVEPGGGTDLEGLLLAGAIRPMAGRRTVAIYLGDGEASLGELDGDLLALHVRAAYRKAGAELHALGLGANPAGDFLRRLTRQCGGQYLGKEPGKALAIENFVAVLDQPLLSDLSLRLDGGCASGFLPDPLPNLARTEKLSVMGLRDKDGPCKAQLTGIINQKAFSQSFILDFQRAEPSPLLPFFWAKQRISHLERKGGDRQEVVQLSKDFGLICRYTSFLVLENEEAYKRFQIERRGQKQQQEIPEAAANKGPLSKARLKSGESISDALKGDVAQPSTEGAVRASAGPSTAASGTASPSRVMAEKESMEQAKAEAPMADLEEARPSIRGGLEDKKTISEKPSAKTKAPSDRPRPVLQITPAEELQNAQRDLAQDPQNLSQRQRLVAILLRQEKTVLTQEQIDQWIKDAGGDPRKLRDLVMPLLDQLPDGDFSRGRRVDVSRKIFAADPSSPEFLLLLVEALQRAGKAQEALKIVEERREVVKKDSDALVCLIPAYARLVSLAEARVALLDLTFQMVKERPLDASLRETQLQQLLAAGLKQEALIALKDWRRFAPDFPNLVMQQADLQVQLGQKQEAQRTLTELVEFNPHDFAARAVFAQQLAAQGQVEKACGEYTRAVQLNPGQKDTFRTMMGLRRSQPKAAAAVQRCIIDGVSRLPVIRDVSIVMLWEDPSADVDMHVIEPSGEEVWYSHLESAQGGHLYYDVTDGFGPEIYVMGTGKPGTYRLGVVYYRGDRPLKGKFVVMRHAGGPEETRQVFPFTLERQDSNKTIPITTFVVGK